MTKALDGAHSEGHEASLKREPAPADTEDVIQMDRDRYLVHGATPATPRGAQPSLQGESQDRNWGARDEVRLRFVGADALPW